MRDPSLAERDGEPPAVTTDEIEAVRAARYSHPDMADACRAAGIGPERVMQFSRIFAQIAVDAAKARKAPPRRSFHPKPRRRT